MARASVRRLWKERIEGGAAPGASHAPGLRLAPAPGRGFAPVELGRIFAGRVLGIDPSLRGTGLALLEVAPGRMPLLLHCRTVRVPRNRSMAEALGDIHRSVTECLDAAGSGGVQHVALELTIYVQNFQTAQILGAARGAAMAAAAGRGLPVFEYAPLRVKRAVAGTGKASKEQLARTVKSLLGHGATLAPDEADAAGVALCHAFTWRE